jgi:hypothetical protein
MRRIGLIVAIALLTSIRARPQGYFDFDNAYALTHIGSINGPLAGTGIWAQMLAGTNEDGLGPVGMPAEHFDILGVPSGRVTGGSVAVPGTVPGQTAYVEMLAWDGTRWGKALSGVPKDQLGMTDVVAVGLAGLFGPPPPLPHFTQSAIVPIPEPSVLGIGIMGCLFALLTVWLRKRPPPWPGGSRDGREGRKPPSTGPLAARLHAGLCHQSHNQRTWIIMIWTGLVFSLFS